MRWLVLCLIATTAFATTPKSPAPLVPQHLTWDMTPQRGFTVLEKAKLSPQHGERHAWIEGADAHTVEPELYWTLPNGRGEARFQWNATAKDFTLDEVQLYLDLDDKQIVAEMDRIVKQFGKPTKTSPENRVWVRGGIWLVVIASNGPDPTTKKWSLSVYFRRDDRPMP